ncbi:hypothetical protein [Nostoc sp.]
MLTLAVACEAIASGASHFRQKPWKTSPQASPWVQRGSKNLVSHLVYLL